MSKYLAIYDLSGIQRFIFATNKMKEIIGASQIVHDVLFSELPTVLGLETDKWITEKITPDCKEDRKIVYIGGGNAMVLYDSPETYNLYTGILHKSVFTMTGGTIRLYSACIELDENTGLKENQKKLMAQLDEAKKRGGTARTAPALPITAADNNNYEPLVLVEDGKYCTASSYAKLISQKTRRSFDEFLPSSQCSFPDNLEAIRKADSKNYQAVIHIDGNTMGIKIREFVSNLSGSIWEQLEKMRDLSVEITNLYKGTLKAAIGDMYGNAVGVIPLRPIVADGDDITVMMEASSAFDFVNIFMKELKGRKIKSFGNFLPTAAAGIAFVGLKFPFSTAYEMAEECCKNAKAVTIRRRGGSEKFLANAVSSMDFQMCYSNIPDSLDSYREANFVFNDYKLMRRPYIFEEGNEYSYYAFEDMAKKWNTDKSTARSKLKGLRNAYGVSVHEANRYMDYIESHVKTSEEKVEAEELIRLVFNEKNESVIFDWLDVMDIIWKETGNK